MNEVHIDGIVVTDVELRRSNKKDIPVADFRIMNRKDPQSKPIYIDVEVWGRQAEIVSENISKRSRVVLHAELRQDDWNSKQTGEKRQKHKLTARRVVFVKDRARTEEEPRSF